MLKQLRLKFVCITMGIVTVMLLVILGMVIHFTARDLERQSLQFLREASSGPGMPGRPGEQTRLPCFTIQQGPGGTLVVLGDELFDLSDEALVEALWSAAQSFPKDAGILKEYELRFMRSGGPRGNRVVFADISAEAETLRNLTLTCLAVGAGSFLLLLGLSFFLARWAIGPVERAWKEQRQFVSDASHELKTPLTVILTNTELLAEDPGGSRSGQCISSIQIMSRQMRGLVESLLELARVDNGAAKGSFQRLNWSDTVSDSVLPLEALFFEAGLMLQTDIQPDIFVKGSQRHLNQVVEILLDNARKYALPNSAVTLSLAHQGNRECLLTVENPAPHLEPEELKDLFKRFYRVDKARSMTGSYGLGLSIAHSVVSDHGGRIWAQSRGDSVTFFVQLPTVS